MFVPGREHASFAKQFSYFKLYQYNTNDPELQTSANHIVISRFRNLQER